MEALTGSFGTLDIDDMHFGAQLTQQAGGSVAHAGGAAGDHYGFAAVAKHFIQIESHAHSPLFQVLSLLHEFMPPAQRPASVARASHRTKPAAPTAMGPRAATGPAHDRHPS